MKKYSNFISLPTILHTTQMKKTTFLILYLIIYCISAPAQEIQGLWKYDNTEFIIKTNKKAYTQAITKYLEKEIAEYYESTTMDFFDDGSYYFDAEEGGQYEIDGNMFIDVKSHKNRIDTVIFDITNNILTFKMNPAKQGFFTPDRLKALNVDNPENIQIKEAEMLIHWVKLSEPTIQFVAPVISKEEYDEYDEPEIVITIQISPATSDDNIKDTEKERTYSQDIIGKWKITKKKPEVTASNKDISKIIMDEFNSFSDNYDTYIQFSKDGEYIEYLLDTEIRISTYKINGNKIKIPGSVDCIYSVDKDTLDLIFDYTKHFISDYPDDKPNSETVKKVVVHTYLKKLPDNFDIEESLKKALVRDSIIVVSKYPDRVKEDIIGKWKPYKTEAIIVSNSEESTQGLKNMTEGLLSDHRQSSLIFDKDYMVERYDSILYTIEGNMLETNKESMPFAINDSILTIDRDLRGALIWMGIGIGDHDRMLSIRKYAARTYYVKVAKEEFAFLKKTYEKFVAFIKNNMQYPPEAIADKKEGKVIVILRIEADGTISYAGVNEEIDPLLDAEAIRIARLMTPEWWEPAKENNIAVPGYTAIQIDFRLPENE